MLLLEIVGIKIMEMDSELF